MYWLSRTKHSYKGLPVSWASLLHSLYPISCITSNPHDHQSFVCWLYTHTHTTKTSFLTNYEAPWHQSWLNKASTSLHLSDPAMTDCLIPGGIIYIALLSLLMTGKFRPHMYVVFCVFFNFYRTSTAACMTMHISVLFIDHRLSQKHTNTVLKKGVHHLYFNTISLLTIHLFQCENEEPS